MGHVVRFFCGQRFFIPFVTYEAIGNGDVKLNLYRPVNLGVRSLVLIYTV